MAVVIVLGHFALLSMQVFEARRVIDLELSRYLRSYLPGVLAALPIIGVFDLIRLLAIDSPLLVLAIGATVFVTAFVTSVLVVNRNKRLPVVEGPRV